MENINYVFRRNLLIPAAEIAANDAVELAVKDKPSMGDDEKDAVWNHVFSSEMQQNSKALESALD
jgi:hypothetical protein